MCVSTSIVEGAHFEDLNLAVVQIVSQYYNTVRKKRGGNDLKRKYWDKRMDQAEHSQESSVSKFWSSALRSRNAVQNIQSD